MSRMKLIMEGWSRFLEEEEPALDEPEKPGEPPTDEEGAAEVDKTAATAEIEQKEINSLKTNAREVSLAAAAAMQKYGVNSPEHVEAKKKAIAAQAQYEQASEDIEDTYASVSPEAAAVVDAADAVEIDPEKEMPMPGAMEKPEENETAELAKQKIANLGQEVASVEEQLEQIMVIVQNLLGKIKNELNESELKNMIKEEYNKTTNGD